MNVSTDPISHYTGNRTDDINGDWLQHLNINDTTNSNNEVRKQHEERPSQQNNGHFIIATFASKTSEKSIWAKRGLKVGGQD